MPKRADIQGIELEVPEDVYRAAPGVSQTLLRELAKSPAHYKAALTAERKQTPAMRLGTLAHLAVFQLPLYMERVVVAPEMDKRSAGYKSFASENEGKEIISVAEHNQIGGMASAVRSHPLVKEWLKEGLAEVSAGVRCPETGVLLKGRFDWMGRGFILDLKTTEDASPDGFSKSVGNYCYHWQAAHYLEIRRLCSIENFGSGAPYDFYFVVVEKDAPFAVAVYELNRHDLTQAYGERLTLLGLLRQCEVEDSWPGYSQEIQDVRLPRWARIDRC